MIHRGLLAVLIGVIAFGAIAQTADVFPTINSPAGAVAGTTFAASVSVTNAGPAPAANVTLVYSPPATLTGIVDIVSFTPPPGMMCTGGEPLMPIHCNAALVLSGQTLTVALVLEVRSYSDNFFQPHHVVTVSTTTPESNTNNNQISRAFGITQVASVSVTKTGPTIVIASSPVSYDITVSNAGPSAPASIELNDALPPGTTFVSRQTISGPPVACSPAPAVSCKFSLDPGQTAVQRITLIAPATPGSFTNSAGIIVLGHPPNNIDPNLSDNIASATSVVAGGSAPALSPALLLLLAAMLAATATIVMRH